MGSKSLDGAIRKAVDDAFSLYAHHIMNPQQAAEVRRDFLRFYAETLKLGMHGIRWNFNGCIACADPKQGDTAIAHGILLISPEVVLAAGGRAFGTVLCRKHITMDVRSQVISTLLATRAPTSGLKSRSGAMVSKPSAAPTLLQGRVTCPFSL